MKLLEGILPNIRRMIAREKNVSHRNKVDFTKLDRSIRETISTFSRMHKVKSLGLILSFLKNHFPSFICHYPKIFLFMQVCLFSEIQSFFKEIIDVLR